MRNESVPRENNTPDDQALDAQARQQLQLPATASDLTELPPIQRGAEVMRFTGTRLEFWLSPTGELRRWLRFNLRVASIIAIPVFIIMPLLNKLLEELAFGSSRLALIANDLAGIPTWLRTGVTVLTIAAFVALIRFLH